MSLSLRLHWDVFAVWLAVVMAYFIIAATPVLAQDQVASASSTFGDLLEKFSLEQHLTQVALPNKTFGVLMAESVGLPEGLPLQAKPLVVAVKTPERPGLSEKAVNPTNFDQLFLAYGDQYGVDPDWLKRIAVCESGLNPGATNDIYAGLFQFSPGTWAATQRRLGLDTDPQLRFDPEAAIRAAAFKISQDGAGAWPVCQTR